MKKSILLIIVYFGIINFISAQTVKWYTFEEAVELNKIKPKKILIDVYTDWCGWCKVMDKNTFSHPVIAKYLNMNFYPVKFNAESKEPVKFMGQTYKNEGNGSRSTHQLAYALLNGKLSYPSIAYMDGKNKLITAVPGYWPAEKIEPLLQFFVDEVYKTSRSFDDYTNNYKSKIK
ncbi:MAG: DUF255 domain-containing protein [Bacteroidales bacterium]|nr:DUF255 domain-containing protein [Bacteroidales bacterium]